MGKAEAVSLRQRRRNTLTGSKRLKLIIIWAKEWNKAILVWSIDTME